MIFRWVVYLFRMLFWALFWPLRRLAKAPDYLLIELKPEMPLVEPPRPSFLRRLMGAKHPLSAWRLNDRLEKLAERPGVKGAVVLLRNGGFGAAQTEAIHNALRRFRDSGREVVVWTKSLDLQRLAIASAGSQVVLAPGGSVGPLGMHRDLLYFGDAVSSLGLKLDVVHSGPHKSAYDRFVNTEPAPEVREMMNWLFDDIYGGAIALIAKGRGVSESDVHAWIDEGLMTDERAEKQGLIDAIDGEAATIRALLKGDGKPPRLVSLDRAESTLRRPPQMPGRPGIAVLRVEGAIVDGVTRRPPLGMPRGGLSSRCGDETLIAQARQLATAKRVKAVVLYIDSPGGSAAASEAMAEALDDLAAKKPLIAVMGSTAASGGYYVATSAKKILASRATITGSIGVIMAKVVSTGLLGKLKVHPHPIKRGERADMFSAGQPFTEDQRALLTEYMERTYRIFIKRVAHSRGLATDVVDGFGRGRVWTGGQALDRGLVDAIGSINDGLRMARDQAGLSPESPVFAPRVPTGAWLKPAKKEESDEARGISAWLDWLGDGLSWVTSGRPLVLSQVVWRFFGK